MTSMESEYVNTDFDLKSATSFDVLHRELSSQCCVLHYGKGKDGNFHASFESSHDGDLTVTGTELDILLIINAIKKLSRVARAEFDACYLREFNIGFNCGDTWGFVHSIPHKVVAAVLDVGCSLAVTLYPMRHPDGSPRCQ